MDATFTTAAAAPVTRRPVVEQRHRIERDDFLGHDEAAASEGT
jgi:hypothetical protein